MSGWTHNDLERMGAAEELQLATFKKDGTLRKPVVIWVVRIGDDLYVRAYRGRGGAWFRHTQLRHEGRISACVKDQDEGRRIIMSQEQPTREEMMQKRRDFVPKLMELNEQVLFGDIWERPGLSKRDRSLITVSALVALYRINELPFHIARARENGVSRDELAELFTHLAFYAGWPSAMTAINIAMEVLAEME